MKKLLITLSSLFLLFGCSTAKEATKNASLVNEDINFVSNESEKPVVRYENKLPTIYPRGTSSHTTYLLLSPFGYIDIEGSPVKGAVSELFYENTVVWKAEPGSDLPTGEQVKSTVSGATFRGWAYYDEDNDNIFPDYYTKVPVKDGLALKAIFDGTSAGGGGGGGGGGSSTVTNITYTITQFADWVPNDGATVFVWSWGGGSGEGAWSQVTLSYLGENNAYTNVTGTFEAPNNITGFNIARCSAGTTLPNWTATGDSAGRVYNKTANVNVQSGVTSYTAPEFVEYEYIA